MLAQLMVRVAASVTPLGPPGGQATHPCITRLP